MEHKRKSFPWGLLTLLAFVAAVTIVVLHAQSIIDYVRLYNYQPPETIARLADETAMSDEGRKLFYVNHPVLADRTTFNQYCSHRGEHTIVLGCYHGIDRGIYLFDVTDDRLAGIEQVTAAHEMLHAAYDRLSAKERRRIDTLLQQYYQDHIHDERLKDTIAAYHKSAPGDVVNEMHSIFPTEIADMPSELEVYYQRYFTDRSRVVSFAAAYQAEFSSRRGKVKAYDEQLKQLKAQMDDNNARLARQEMEIDSLRSRMEMDRSSGNIEAYNRQVPIFNGMIAAYNARISTTQSQINTYNRIVAERNALAAEVKDLAKSIDSNLVPIRQ